MYSKYKGTFSYDEILNPYKAGLGKDTGIFWSINDPPGLQGLNAFKIYTEVTKSIFYTKNILHEIQL